MINLARIDEITNALKKFPAFSQMTYDQIAEGIRLRQERDEIFDQLEANIPRLALIENNLSKEQQKRYFDGRP